MIPSNLKIGDVVVLAKLDTKRDRHRRRAERNLGIVTEVQEYHCIVRSYITRSDGTSYYKNFRFDRFDMVGLEDEIIIKSATKDAMLYKLEHA